jgi:hypothetical protein
MVEKERWEGMMRRGLKRVRGESEFMYEGRGQR